MDDAIQVEVGEGQGHIVAQIHLEVVGEWFVGSLKKCSKRFVHQLHQQDKQARLWVTSHSKVLNHMGVPYLTQEFTLLLKPLYNGLAARIIELEEDRMEELGCTGKLVEYCLADLSIGPNAKGFLR